MIPIRPWQLLLLLLMSLITLVPVGGHLLDLALNGRTDLEIGSRLAPNTPIAPFPPVQMPLDHKGIDQMDLNQTGPIPHQGFHLYPVARFETEALVLSRNVQRWPVADAARDLAPLDLALGWGLMSTPSEIAKLKIWQWGRFYYWRVRGGERFDPRAAIPLSTNVHLIPATPEVRRALMRVREGDLIRLEGRLVDAHHPELGWWRSSRTRTDTGNGACEILFVERVLPQQDRTELPDPA